MGGLVFRILNVFKGNRRATAKFWGCPHSEKRSNTTILNPGIRESGWSGAKYQMVASHGELTPEVGLIEKNNAKNVVPRFFTSKEPTPQRLRSGSKSPPMVEVSQDQTVFHGTTKQLNHERHAERAYPLVKHPKTQAECYLIHQSRTRLTSHISFRLSQ